MTESNKQEIELPEVKEQIESPRVFISYSWTSSAHEEWVLIFATQLRGEDGIDIILDKWYLKEGQDKYAFMEKMVTDETVKKVLVICDKKYAEKADGRKGGVGTESQIMSPEVYNKVEQTKFIPIVTEFDEEGEAYLPQFMKGRIYIDMSSQAKYVENYDRVIRAILDKPLHQKPTLGTIPKRILHEKQVYFGTELKFRECIEAIKEDKNAVPSLLKSYFEEVARSCEHFRIKDVKDGEILDDLIIASIKNLMPLRDELIELWDCLLTYRDKEEDLRTIHVYFETMAVFRYRPNDVLRWNDMWADNFAFFNYELFLYLIALILKHEKYDALNIFLDESYFVKFPERLPGMHMSYNEFHGYASSLEQVRKKRLKLNRASIVADLVKERAVYKGIDFELIMLADFVITLRSLLDSEKNTKWYPLTLVFSRFHGAFEFFARGASKKDFAIVKQVFKVESKDDLLLRLSDGMNRSQVDNWHEFMQPREMIVRLLCFDELDTLR